MINWDKKIETANGAATVMIRHGGIQIEVNDDSDRVIRYLVDKNGHPLNEALNQDFIVRNVISRKEKILIEVSNLLRSGAPAIRGDCPELVKLLEEIDK